VWKGGEGVHWWEGAQCLKGGARVELIRMRTPDRGGSWEVRSCVCVWGGGGGVKELGGERRGRGGEVKRLVSMNCGGGGAWGSVDYDVFTHHDLQA
jgi:hypothetical protein